VKVADFEWRDYSIADVEGARVGFLISTRTGGYGSRYVINAQPGSETVLELPLGHYGLARNERRKVFIATGTGLAPFLPMFRRLRAEGDLGDVDLYFGCRTAAEDITRHLNPLPGTVVRCLSREAPPPGGFKGRVSQAIVELMFDPARTEFYLCGSAAMVADCRDELERRGARYIHIELY
jgi:ferredoxin-NADP reductase